MKESLQNFVEEIKKIDFNSLDPNHPEAWPLPVQIGVMVIVFVILLYAGYHFDISKQREELASVTQKEQELKETFETKQRKAANLDKLKEQMEEMEQSFGDMIRQLPNKAEVAGLIVDISQTGLAAGLKFDLFQPQAEVQKEFYSQLPISIRVTGNYHQLGEFVSGIAALPRIVTTHNISIAPAQGDDTGQLSMSATAQTYRAIDEEES